MPYTPMQFTLTWEGMLDEYEDAAAAPRDFRDELERIRFVLLAAYGEMAWAQEAAARLADLLGDCFAAVTLGDRAANDGDRDALDRHTRALGEHAKIEVAA